MPRIAWNKLEPEEKRRRNAARCKAYHAANRERHILRCREHREKNRERLNALALTYYAKNKETMKVKFKQYAKDHRPSINAMQAAYKNSKRRTNPSFQIALNVRERIRYGLRADGAAKSASTETLLGCSFEFLRGFLEAKFTPGMSWDNYGKWHIDHILPCTGFDLTDGDQQRRCFHYTNLQPLWAVDNVAKSDRLPNGIRARTLIHKTQRP